VRNETTDDVEPAATLPFDFETPADLYFPLFVGRRSALDYRRFPSAAAAILYAAESLTAPRLAAATLEIDGTRYDAGTIRQLYASPEFPLARA
jgi:hypothetical protein